MENMEKINRVLEENPSWKGVVETLIDEGVNDAIIQDMTEEDIRLSFNKAGDRITCRKIKEKVRNMGLVLENQQDKQENQQSQQQNQQSQQDVENTAGKIQVVGIENGSNKIITLDGEIVTIDDHSLHDFNENNETTNNGEGNEGSSKDSEPKNKDKDKDKDKEKNKNKEILDIPQLSRMKSKEFVQNMDLETVISSDLDGKCIIKYYKKYTKLGNEKQLKVSRIVIQHLILNGVKFDAELYSMILTKIMIVFPQEDPDDFCIIASDGEVSGKLINMKRNEMYRVNHFDDDEEEGNNRNENDKRKMSNGGKSVEKISDLYIWLKNNSGPFEEVVKHWELSFSERKTDMMGKMTSDQFILKWYHIKNEGGEVLLEMDFQYLYPEKSNVFYEGWQKLVEKMEHLKAKIKSPIFKKLIETVDDSTSEDERDFILLRCLPAALNYNYMIRYKKSKLWRPSLIERSDALIQHVKIAADVQKTINQRLDKMETLELRCQPFIIVQGADLALITAAYVYFDGDTFKFDSVQRAIEMAFKIFMTTNFIYPKEARFSWYFLQKYIWEISTESDPKGSFVPDFIQYLNTDLSSN